MQKTCIVAKIYNDAIKAYMAIFEQVLVCVHILPDLSPSRGLYKLHYGVMLARAQIAIMKFCSL